MKGIAIISLALVLLLLTAALTAIRLSNTVAAQSAGDIVLMKCRTKGTVSAPRPIEIDSYANSSGAPSVPADLTNCAQTLADIVNVGFTIRDIKSHDTTFSFYTLTR